MANSKKKVLVFPCGSEIGLEIYESVAFSTHFQLIGGSSVSDHGEFVYEKYIDGIPYVDDAKFIDAINDIITAHEIDYIFPAHDSAVLRFAQARADRLLKCEVVTSELETCEIARSKLKTYQKLAGIIPVPKLFDVKDITEADYPIFLKPDVGQGSKGVQLAKTKDDLLYFTSRDPGLLVMEYLPGSEYTIDCFTDFAGDLRFCEGRVRTRISNGISVSAQTVKDERFRTIAEKINASVRFNGVWFFQLKENSSGDLVLLEIAPRVAGTMGHERVRGVNLALMSLFNAENIDVEFLLNDYDVITDRSLKALYKHSITYDHAYIDLDDVLIIDGKVNLRVVAFIFQCRNNGVKVHLITKHADHLPTTLKKFGLNDLFDSIAHVKEGEHKYNYVAEKSAVFIDDSHQERKAIFENCGIPVFDVHSLDMLMEKI